MRDLNLLPLAVLVFVVLMMTPGCGREHRWDGTYQINNTVGRLSSSINAEELFPEVGMRSGDQFEVTTSVTEKDTISMGNSVYSVLCTLDWKDGSSHRFLCQPTVVQDSRLGPIQLDLWIHIDVERCWRGLFIGGEVTSDTDATHPAGPAHLVGNDPWGCTGGAIGV